VLYAGRVVEDGATRDVLAAPRHPYTAALLKATPRLDRPAEALAPLPRSLIETLLAEAHAYDRANAGAYR
jgi:oligopeptide/dipeptide ABC transporter ATP-binding protein